MFFLLSKQKMNRIPSESIHRFTFEPQWFPGSIYACRSEENHNPMQKKTNLTGLFRVIIYMTATFEGGKWIFVTSIFILWLPSNVPGVCGATTGSTVGFEAQRLCWFPGDRRLLNMTTSWENISMSIINGCFMGISTIFDVFTLNLEMFPKGNPPELGI